MTAKPPDMKPERTLRGVIIPVAWRNGRVIEAAISARDEKVYQVLDQAQQQWLLENLQREVQATGPVTIRQGRNYLSLRHWSLVDPGWDGPLEGTVPGEPAPPGPARAANKP